MMRGSAFVAAALITLLAGQDQARSNPQSNDHGDHDDDHDGHHGDGNSGNGGHHGSWWHGGHRQFAAVFELASKVSLLQTGDSSWTLTKTAAVDATAKTVTWNIAATKNSTSGGHLVVDGFLDVINLGTGPATLGNIVVNLQAKQNNHWVTISSDVADATQGDNATSAHVVGEDTSEGHDVYSENAASGSLSFLDRRFNTIFSLVPEFLLGSGDHLPLLFSASYDNNLLHLATNTSVRFEVVVTFGNHPLGGPHHTDENVDINGNGVIDEDEHKVRSISDVFTQKVPAQKDANATLALSDTAADVSAQGTVTYTAPVVNLNATTGTVKVSYDAGTSGGTITNCVHGTGTGITDPVGSFTFTAVMPVSLTTCTTATIAAPPSCTPGAPGCGWHDGDLITYDQNIWGGTASNMPPPPTPAFLLLQDFDAVYPATMILGRPTGNFLQFTNGDDLLSYLPASGDAAALNRNLVDTHMSASGIFGGQVAALRLNIDFNDNGTIIPGAATGVKFGDLHVCGLATTPAFNNLSVRQISDAVNIALGGGVAPYAYDVLSTLTGNLNASFEGGFVSTFAQDHVVNGSCP